MIEASIIIDRELAYRGYKKAYGAAVLTQGAGYYSALAFWIFLAVALIDVVFDSAHLIGVHLGIIGALALGASVYHYFDWLKKLDAGAADYELDVILDDDGVTIKNADNKRLEWDSYAYFKEYGDYLEITDKEGVISLLPKRDEYARVIIFTKTKIPAKEF